MTICLKKVYICEIMDDELLILLRKLKYSKSFEVNADEFRMLDAHYYAEHREHLKHCLGCVVEYVMKLIKRYNM